jgi:hypothetical protein
MPFHRLHSRPFIALLVALCFTGVALGDSSAESGGVRHAARVQALTPEECASLLRAAGYVSSLRHFGDLRRVLRSKAYAGQVSEWLDQRQYQLVIWELEAKGEFEAARVIEGYARAALLDSRVIGIQALAGTSQPTRVELQGGIKAVFKPYRSHYAKTWDKREVGWLSNPVIEVLAYELDRTLGLGMVPITVEREIGGVRGSLQLWVENDRAELKAVPQALLHRMHVFDYLIRNQDRRSANLFYDSGRLVLIDQSMSLNKTYLMWNREYEPTAERVFSSPMPADLIESLREKLTDSVIDQLLGGKLEPEVIEAMKRRRQEILRFADAP